MGDKRGTNFFWEKFAGYLFRCGWWFNSLLFFSSRAFFPRKRLQAAQSTERKSTPKKRYKMVLYLSKGSAEALPMGSNWFSYGVLSLVNEKSSFNYVAEIHQKISAKNLYCAGGGWWVVGGRWTKRSFNFLCFQIY